MHIDFSFEPPNRSRFTPGSATLRSQFPLLNQEINGHQLVYLDNGASTVSPIQVIQTQSEFESKRRSNIHRGVHSLSQRATAEYEEARATLKTFIGATDKHEVVFTSGTTESLNMVAHGLSSGGHRRPWLREGDEIIVSGLEHHANLLPWQQAARVSGAALVILQPDEYGQLHCGELERLITMHTRVVALAASANATGERPPYEDLLRIASRGGALTVLDAAQAAAHAMPDLSAIECDFMAFSGHKIHGPMGIGVLAGKRNALELLSPTRLGGDMVTQVSWQDAKFADLPANLEGGTPNVTGAIGLAAAVKFIERVGRKDVAQHVYALRSYAAKLLSQIPGIVVLSAAEQRSAVVSFVAEDVHPHDIGSLLDERGIAVRTGHHCAQPLMDHLGYGPSTRASFAMYNTMEEVDRLVEAVARAMEILK